MAQGTAVESSLPGEVELPPDDVELPPDEGSPDVAVETRAREMGWKPLAEYRGPPGRWQPAKDFIERGENILPIVRDQNRRLTERVGKLEGEISGLRSTAEEQLKIIKDLHQIGARQNQAGYDRAMADVRLKQRQAVEVGDTKAYDQLVEQEEALLESRPAATPAAPAAVAEPARPAAPAPVAPSLTPTTQAFIRENPWFNTDKLLSDTMVAFHQEVLNERQATQASLNADPELDRELLEEAKSRVAERYPDRMGVTPAPRQQPDNRRAARRAAPVAAPTADAPAPRPGAVALTINSIQDPAERAQVREAFSRLRRQLPETTEADYMAIYNDPHGDVLAMQAKPRSQPNGR
jgi:hypothetical protein